MGSGGRSGLKRGSNRRVRVMRKYSEDLDEDYVAEIDEKSDESELESSVGDASEGESMAKKSRGKRSANTSRKPVRKRKMTRSSRRKEKKKHGLRNKRWTTESDSKSCSEPSDYELVTSEEEREHVRDVNEMCGRVATNLRSSRRIQKNEVSCEKKKRRRKRRCTVRTDSESSEPSDYESTISEQQRELLRKYLKENAKETENDVGKHVCGICLTEERKNIIRGILNCCSHYFCFGCIMEWSEVESRCPLCKQRFITISQAARHVEGIRPRNTVIQVPERNQVHQPSEEEIREFLNPYENVICTECHNRGNDELMLICELCDSLAHTFCVGVGRQLPEGNWYCDGCNSIATSYFQNQDAPLDQSVTGGYDATTGLDLSVSVPVTPLSHGNSGSSSQALSLASGVTTVGSRRRMQRRMYIFLMNRLQEPGVNNLRENYHNPEIRGASPRPQVMTNHRGEQRSQ